MREVGTVLGSALWLAALGWVEGFTNMTSLDPHNPVRQIVWLCSDPRSKEIITNEGRDPTQAYPLSHTASRLIFEYVEPTF